MYQKFKILKRRTSQNISLLNSFIKVFFHSKTYLMNSSINNNKVLIKNAYNRKSF